VTDRKEFQAIMEAKRIDQENDSLFRISIAQIIKE